MTDRSFCDVVPPSDMGDSRLREVESLLARCSGVLGGYLEDSGLGSRPKFFMELMRKHRPGSGCLVGSAEVSAEDASQMMMVKEAEGELLGHFSKMTQQVVARRARAHGKDGDALHADAYEAFFTAMLNYDGSVRFSTYLQTCLSHNINRACMKDSFVRVPAEVRRLSMRVVGRMGEGATFDEAVEGLDEDAVRGVVASMRRVQTATDLEVNESEMAVVEDRESVEWVGRALEGVNFTRLERAALQGFMDAPCGVMGLSSALKGLINPDTGKEYSRAAISAAWAQARKKIRRALEAA